MIQCPACSTENPDNVEMCTSCGELLQDRVARESSALRRQTFVIVGSLAVAVVAVAWVLFAYLPKEQKLNGLNVEIRQAFTERRWGHADSLATVLHPYEPSVANRIRLHVETARSLAQRTFDFVPLRTFSIHDSPVIGMSFLPDSLGVISVSGDSTAAIWNAKTGVVRDRKSGVPPTPAHAVFTHDGKIMATAENSDHRITVLRFPRGKRLAELRGHRREVKSLSITQRGTFVVSAGSDSTVRVWHVPSQSEVQRFDVAAVSAAISPDGRFILIGDEHGRVTTWGVR
jgi:hypothetical protein